jgi:hypothetical protein
VDYAAHNEEVRQVWEAYRAGRPIRVPMILGISAQWTLSMPAANPSGFTFRQYLEDPQAMLQHQLERSWWIRHCVPQDAEMGLPDYWSVFVDGQNIFEAGWLGGKIVIRDLQPPSAEPVLSEERKYALLDQGVPDPFAGYWAQWAWERYEYFQEQAARGLEFHGRPFCVTALPGLGTDGPFTIAYQLRGAAALCMDIYLDPDYFHALMTLITEATIQRIKAYRRKLGQAETGTAWSFADDAVALLSPQTYRDHVLPYHRRLIETFGPQGPNTVHLCGDAAHLFPILRDELQVRSFDTGYPLDFGQVRAALGPEVEIYGGVRIDLLRKGPPAAIAAEVQRIMNSGIREGGRFVLRDANNVAPHTPLEHVAAMYQACRQYGRY